MSADLVLDARDPEATPKSEATRRQSEASHPAFSAWVSANAGSGKTHVLARRVIRLLLAGTPPGRILCLTYTKAAAANMANRVLAILGRWVRLPDGELDAAIRDTVGSAPDAALRARARRRASSARSKMFGCDVILGAASAGVLPQYSHSGTSMRSGPENGNDWFNIPSETPLLTDLIRLSFPLQLVPARATGAARPWTSPSSCLPD